MNVSNLILIGPVNRSIKLRRQIESISKGETQIDTNNHYKNPLRKTVYRVYRITIIYWQSNC